MGKMITIRASRVAVYWLRLGITLINKEQGWEITPSKDIRKTDEFCVLVDGSLFKTVIIKESSDLQHVFDTLNAYIPNRFDNRKG